MDYNKFIIISSLTLYYILHKKINILYNHSVDKIIRPKFIQIPKMEAE